MTSRRAGGLCRGFVVSLSAEKPPRSRLAGVQVGLEPFLEAGCPPKRVRSNVAAWLFSLRACSSAVIWRSTSASFCSTSVCQEPGVTARSSRKRRMSARVSPASWHSRSSATLRAAVASYRRCPDCRRAGASSPLRSQNRIVELVQRRVGSWGVRLVCCRVWVVAAFVGWPVVLWSCA